VFCSLSVLFARIEAKPTKADASKCLGLQLTTLAITMNYFEEITVQQAAELIGADNQLWILDTRDANSYQEQHIDGAMQAHAGLIEHLIKKQDYAGQ
jgi:hypothetical protein